MRKRKLSLILSLIMLTTIVLTGCGGGSGESATTPATSELTTGDNILKLTTNDEQNTCDV
jgi:ABC-type glycerol-3-phosphate transport system substrate-binding protein